MILRNLLFLLILTASTLSQAQSKEEYVRLSIANLSISGETGTASVNIDLNEGWHTYALDPGDSGLPPQMNWDQSKNATDFTLNWPTPLTIQEHGLTVYGYKSKVQIPLSFQISETENSGEISLTATILICNKICIPKTLHASVEFAP